MPTPVQKALELIEKDGLTVYAAAKKIGIPATSVYTARNRAEMKKLKGYIECPCCGSQVLASQIKKKK